MGKAVNGPPDLEIDVTILSMELDIILLLDMFSEIRELDSHVLIPVHCCEKVIVFDIDAHVICSGRAEYAVPQDLDIVK